MALAPLAQPNTFGARVTYARKAAGLTQRVAAEKAGIHYATLSGWENDRVSVSEVREPNLRAYGQATGFSADWLRKGGPTPERAYMPRERGAAAVSPLERAGAFLTSRELIAMPWTQLEPAPFLTYSSLRMLEAQVLEAEGTGHPVPSARLREIYEIMVRAALGTRPVRSLDELMPDPPNAPESDESDRVARHRQQAKADLEAASPQPAQDDRRSGQG